MLAILFNAFCAWTILILLISSIWITLRKGASHIQRLHQIPCHNCDFFTNDYRLKCTINPIKACTEDAIACRDFEFKTSSCNACQKHPHKPFRFGKSLVIRPGR
ncbi:MAG: hypothetical protein KME60_11890 [Cyanomargarita calcarea GSE-NOS-MK-12-04C]|uniref:Uncharacterized protein n=1 Tax=Cyanomargarita calcarea GSE-NOS-MK-12-04C TaxID=2839659 RepID=A0A951QKL8_9CYAN|nr:hypothetical protein [Cyanomargarita calcarea GSE-NOS-MK-12-04C]